MPDENENMGLDAADMLVALSPAVKALGDGRIGGYLVLYGDAEHPDISPQHDYFAADTDYDLEDGAGKSSVYYHHGRDPQLGTRKLTTGTLKQDNVGVWLEAQLALRDEYEKAIYRMAEKGKLGLSSGSVAHLVEREPQPNGAQKITKWPLGLDASLTPIPAEPRTRVLALKAYLAESESLSPLPTSDDQPAAQATPLAAGDAAADALKAVGTVAIPLETETNVTGDTTMDDMKQLLTEALAPLTAELANMKAAMPLTSPGFAVPVPAEPKTDEPLYRSFGDFLLDVAKSAQGPTNRRMEELKSADPLDENGYNIAKAMGMPFVGSLAQAAMKAPMGLHEGLGSTGGFLVGTDRNASLLERMYDTGQLLSRVDMTGISAGSNGMTFNAEDETSRADGSRRGGILAYWTAEAGSKTPSQPKFRQMELKLKKVVGLVYSTDELLADATALENYIMRNLPEELRFKVEDAVINGTGAGMPLGVLNSGALVSVAKEANQAADTVLFQNVVKMYSRMWARSLPRAVWYINQNVWPQLYQMSLAVGTGGSAAFLPPNGLSAAPYGTLMGRPVMPLEYCDTVGDLGDILFADLGEYQMIEKGGMQSASSIHVKFTTDETCYRFVYRVDGQPKWNSPLTPKNTTDTVSPFVTLAERA